MKFTPFFHQICTKTSLLTQLFLYRYRMQYKNNNPGTDDGKYYRVRIRERVDNEMLDWFGGMEVQVGENATVLEGKMVDQSELQGLLRKIHDLHLTLISVETLSE